jgi:hypothetical protein
MELPISLVGWTILAGTISVTALTAIGLRFAINYAQENTKNSLFDRLCQWARIYVAVLEQDPSLGGLASDEKKERAMLWLVTKAEELGIPLTADEASKLIENAVYLVKNVALPAVDEALG